MCGAAVDIVEFELWVAFGKRKGKVRLLLHRPQVFHASCLLPSMTIPIVWMNLGNTCLQRKDEPWISFLLQHIKRVVYQGEQCWGKLPLTCPLLWTGGLITPKAGSRQHCLRLALHLGSYYAVAARKDPRDSASAEKHKCEPSLSLSSPLIGGFVPYTPGLYVMETSSESNLLNYLVHRICITWLN